MESPEKNKTSMILTDSEIFDNEIHQRLKAILISMGLQFDQEDMEYYNKEIPLFIQNM
jgi:hypothetical protein